jgi:hypothetical protein
VRASSSTLKNWFEGRIDQVAFSGSVLYTENFTPPTQFPGANGSSVVTLNWSLPTIGLVVGYNVYRQSDDAVLWKLNYGPPTLQTSFVDDSPHLGDNCYYVVAVTPQGLEGAPTATTCLNITIEELSTDARELPPIRNLDLRVAPNPFNPSTHVFFSLPGVSDVTFSLFDVTGRRVRSWTLLQQPAGHHSLPLNLSQGNHQAASGIYFLRVESRFEKAHKRVVLIK